MKEIKREENFWGIASVLFLFLTVSILLLLFWGRGALYLLQEGVFSMAEAQYEDYKRQNGMTYLERLESDTQLKTEELSEKPYVKAYADPADGLSRDSSTNVLSQELAGQIAKYIIYLHEQDEDNTNLKEFAEQYGIEYAVFLAGGRRMYGNLPVSEETYAWKCRCLMFDKETGYYAERYVVKLRAMDKGKFEYLYAVKQRLITMWVNDRELVLKCALLSFTFSGLVFLVLLVMVIRLGRKKQSLLARVPIEIMAGGCGFLVYVEWRRAVAELELVCEVLILKDSRTDLWQEMNPLIWPVLESVMCTLFLLFHLLRRLQDAGWYRHSLVYMTIRLGMHLLREWKKMLMELTMTRKAFAAALVISLAEGGVLILLFRTHAYVYFALGLWALEKAILLPLLMKYIAAVLKLEKAAGQIADGDTQCRLETAELPVLLRGFGEDLNDMAGSVSKAVEQKMQSERLKTELITNVSHDIKTPLTSIINFSDLISKENTDNAKITEYAEHLHHQSSRLKKLIEDLMEASKASTGNLEVHLEPCDIKVLLGQCLGEFEARLGEMELELIVQQSEKELRILADTRMLWRVFENLMNNICKYAQKETRVYLSAEEAKDRVRITFKNVSRYALNVPPKELMERFVRGDLSRHTEGSGLGLSIVSSLMELQGGKLTLLTDGDLFKAILEFPVFDGENEVDYE